MKDLLEQLHAANVEKAPSNVSDLPSLDVIREVHSEGFSTQADDAMIKARLALPSLPLSEEFLDDVPASPHGYKIESVDIWRMLTICASKFSLWDLPDQSTWNSLSRLPIMIPPTRYGFEITIEDHASLKPAASVQMIGDDMPANKLPPAFHEVEVPKKDLAKRMIRNAPVVPTKGYSGESYVCSTAHLYPVTGVVALCMTIVPYECRVFKVGDLELLKKLRGVLSWTARLLWGKKDHDNRILAFKIMDYEQEAFKNDRGKGYGIEVFHGKYPLLRAAKDHFMGDEQPFEIEDVAKFARDCLSSDTEDVMKSSRTVGDHALAMWNSRARWLVLALLLNAHENVEGARALPTKFEELLNSTHCCLLP